MNNLEKIRKAYAMGWAAKVSIEGLDESILVSIFEANLGSDEILQIEEVFAFRYSDGEIENRLGLELNAVITSYLYMGQLGGNEEPEEGQKFKSKKNPSDTFKIHSDQSSVIYDSVMIRDEYDRMWEKNEIEPIF